MTINSPKIFFKRKRKIKNTLINLFQPKTEDSKISSLKLSKNFSNFTEIKIIVKSLNKWFTNLNQAGLGVLE